MSRLTDSNSSAHEKPTGGDKPTVAPPADTALQLGSDLGLLDHDALARIADTPVLRERPASVLALFSSTRHTSAVSQAPLDLTNFDRRLTSEDMAQLQRTDSRFVLRGVRLSQTLQDDELQSTTVATLRQLDLSGCTEISDISSLRHC